MLARTSHFSAAAFCFRLRIWKAVRRDKSRLERAEHTARSKICLANKLHHIHVSMDCWFEMSLGWSPILNQNYYYLRLQVCCWYLRISRFLKTAFCRNKKFAKRKITCRLLDKNGGEAKFLWIHSALTHFDPIPDSDPLLSGPRSAIKTFQTIWSR